MRGAPMRFQQAEIVACCGAGDPRRSASTKTGKHPAPTSIGT